ncbi:gliding motility-associated C-terminal domain-containing protein [Phnomibacter sp. MR]|uniref:gliding motility-associated C-terminal domain-containing protein n=1 Tax=Phnomibacter sp. MR TaxID=3042318 RepID=UPI003A7F8CF7
MLKKNTPHLILLIILVVSTFSSQAETFWVTSNADAGPNTLREALQKAAANGVVEKDSILFNIPTVAGNPEIRIDSVLPIVSGNLIIDGSSQPAAKIGITDARVIISFDQSTIQGYYYALNLGYNNDIEIYGLQMKSYGISNGYGYFGLLIAIFTPGNSNITIGKPGKGNHFTGWLVTIGQEAHWNDVPLKTCHNIKIQSNIIGVLEDGLTHTYGTNPFAVYDASCRVGINYKELDNITIGGPNPEEGNLISYLESAINAIHTQNYRGDTTRPSLIQHNIIGTDINRMEPTNFNFTNFPAVWCGGLDSLKILDNHIMGQNIIAGLHVAGCTDFEIKGNVIGLDKTKKGSRTKMSQGIVLGSNRRGLIGGPLEEDKNYIGYTNNLAGIFSDRSFGVTISRNSVFCHDRLDIELFAWDDYGYYRDRPFITINKKIGNTISGTAPAKAKIEIFYDTTCKSCQTQQYVTTVEADANGKWTYENNSGYQIVATATDTTGSTSGTSVAELGDQNLPYNEHIPETCGKKNGGTKGVRIVSGTYWHWEDSNGQIISKDTNLTNVGAGLYTLKYGLYEGICLNAVSVQIRSIDSIPFPPDILTINPASCGKKNGSIQVSDYFNKTSKDYLYQWQKADGTALDVFQPFLYSDSIRSLFPGDYYVFAKAKNDSTCTLRLGPYRMSNSNGPSLDLSNIQIKNSSCNKSNGAITNINVLNGSGTIWFQWMNSAGNILSNQKDLVNVSPGNYRLRMKDASSCDTLVSDWFTIAVAGFVQIDTTNMQIVPSKCIAASGTINGIVITGNFTAQWLNETGTTISSSLDPGLLFPGKYMLKISSTEGCDSVLGPFIVSSVPTFDYDPQLQVSYTPATCAENNGSVTILNHPSLPGYSYRWVASSAGNGPALSTTFSLQNMTAGTSYYFFLKDSKGCEQLGFTAKNNVLFPKPSLNETALLIQPVTCVTSGSIAGLSVTQNPSAQPFQYLWRNQAGDSIANSINIGQLTAGSYALKVTDQYNCSISKSFTVGSSVLSLTAPAYTDLRIKRGSSASIAVTNVQASGNYTLFTTAATTVAVQQNANGRFALGTINKDTTVFVQFEKDGCVSSRSIVRIFVYDETIITIPNAFSPNNDGINDIMTIKTQGITALVKLSIFDRFGAVLYSSNEPQKGWNGQSKQGNVPAGTYYYILEAVAEDNKRIVKQGSILLLR